MQWHIVQHTWPPMVHGIGPQHPNSSYRAQFTSQRVQFPHDASTCLTVTHLPAASRPPPCARSPRNAHCGPVLTKHALNSLDTLQETDAPRNAQRCAPACTSALQWTDLFCDRRPGHSSTYSVSRVSRPALQGPVTGMIQTHFPTQMQHTDTSPSTALHPHSALHCVTTRTCHTDSPHLLTLATQREHMPKTSATVCSTTPRSASKHSCRCPYPRYARPCTGFHQRAQLLPLTHT